MHVGWQLVRLFLVDFTFPAKRATRIVKELRTTILTFRAEQWHAVSRTICKSFALWVAWSAATYYSYSREQLEPNQNMIWNNWQPHGVGSDRQRSNSLPGSPIPLRGPSCSRMNLPIYAV
jgi:hypothetical protein